LTGRFLRCFCYLRLIFLSRPLVRFFLLSRSGGNCSFFLKEVLSPRDGRGTTPTPPPPNPSHVRPVNFFGVLFVLPIFPPYRFRPFSFFYNFVGRFLRTPFPPLDHGTTPNEFPTTPESLVLPFHHLRPAKIFGQKEHPPFEIFFFLTPPCRPLSPFLHRPYRPQPRCLFNLFGLVACPFPFNGPARQDFPFCSFLKIRRRGCLLRLPSPIDLSFTSTPSLLNWELTRVRFYCSYHQFVEIPPPLLSSLRPRKRHFFVKETARTRGTPSPTFNHTSQVGFPLITPQWIGVITLFSFS